jgi:hypothetical protein
MGICGNVDGEDDFIDEITWDLDSGFWILDSGFWI